MSVLQETPGMHGRNQPAHQRWEDPGCVQRLGRKRPKVGLAVAKRNGTGMVGLVYGFNGGDGMGLENLRSTEVGTVLGTHVGIIVVGIDVGTVVGTGVGTIIVGDYCTVSIVVGAGVGTFVAPLEVRVQHWPGEEYLL
jgi:hypothetical protein